MGGRSIQWSILLGYAFNFDCGWLMFTGSLFDGPLEGEVFPRGLLYTISLAVNCVTLGALVVYMRRHAPLFEHRFAVPVGVAALSVGAIFVFDQTLVWLDNLGLCVLLAGILTGIGQGILSLLWGEVLVALGTRGCLAHCAASSLVAAAIHLAVGMLPEIVGQCSVVVLAIAQGVLFRVYYTHHTFALRKTNFDAEGTTGIEVGIVSITMLFGIMFGLGEALSFSGGAQVVNLISRSSMTFVVLGSAAVCVTLLVRDINFGQSIYKVGIVIVASGFALMSVAGPTFIVGASLHRIGYEYSNIMLTALWCFFASRPDVKTSYVVALGVFLGQASLLASRVAGDVFLGSAASLMGVAGVSCFALFVIVLYVLFGERVHLVQSGWRNVRLVEEGRSVGFDEEAYATVARLLEFSPREKEVFLLMIQGRSRSYIAKRLFISEETVKTHVSRLYKKADVHSKQELIDKASEMLANMR